MKIIILGHGHFASGILSSLELIAGSQEHVKAIDFTASMSSDELEQALGKAIQDKEILILCDLLGGTPFKVASLYANSHPQNHINVVSGLNLTMLLEVVFSGSTNSDDVVEQVMETGRRGIVSAKELFSQETEDSFEDGI